MQVWFKCDPDNLGAFNSSVPQRAQHVQPSWANASLGGICHGERRWWSVRTPETATQTQNSGQLSLLWRAFHTKSAIGAIRRNKPLNHRWTTVWWSVLSWYLFGCQGRPSWIGRSGKRFQCWCNSRQCQGFVSRRSQHPAPSRAEFCRFRYCLWPSVTPLTPAQKCGLHRATILARTTGGLQAQTAIILTTISKDWRALAARIPFSPMSHFFMEAAVML